MVRRSFNTFLREKNIEFYFALPKFGSVSHAIRSAGISQYARKLVKHWLDEGFIIRRGDDFEYTKKGKIIAGLLKELDSEVRNE